MAYQLPEKSSEQFYGWFGYEGAMCDQAIRRDNVEMLKTCIEKGFIDADSKTFDGKSMFVYAMERGCEKVGEYMNSIGWQ